MNEIGLFLLRTLVQKGHPLIIVLDEVQYMNASDFDTTLFFAQSIANGSLNGVSMLVGCRPLVCLFVCLLCFALPVAFVRLFACLVCCLVGGLRLYFHFSDSVCCFVVSLLVPFAFVLAVLFLW